MFIRKPIKDITEADLLGLISADVREGKQIEYKQRLDLDTADHKRKLLRAVASFANASGGDLIMGVRAEDGVAKEAIPIPNFNPDAESLRMRDLIRAHLDPPIFGVEFNDIPLKSGCAFIVRVPRSWSGPHMVTYDGEDHFYTRDENGCIRMNVPEIRAAFTMTESLAERIRRFRVERLATIRASELAVDVDPGPKYIIHVLPFQSFQHGFRCDFKDLYQNHAPQPLKCARGYTHTHDIEGFYGYESVKDEASTGYSLVFRTGAIEIVQCIVGGAAENRVIPNQFEADILRAYASSLNWLRMTKMEAPLVFACSVFDVQNFSLYFRHGDQPYHLRPIRHRDLIIPEVLVETLEMPGEQALRPICDAVWQACGLMGSFNFDEKGKFRGDQK
jgi:hypothetical protein